LLKRLKKYADKENNNMWKEMSLTEFISRTASADPVPGGGSIAALTAAQGAGLVGMLASLTKGKTGYEPIWEKMSETADVSAKQAQRFLDFIQKDVDVFNEYMAVLKMPKDTDEQKAARSALLQKAVINATEVPLSLAKECYGFISVAEYTIDYGNKGATSDGCIAVLLLKSAALAALYNVKINLPSIKDEAAAKRIAEQMKEIETGSARLEAAILSKVTF